MCDAHLACSPSSPSRLIHTLAHAATDPDNRVRLHVYDRHEKRVLRLDIGTARRHLTASPCRFLYESCVFMTGACIRIAQDGTLRRAIMVDGTFGTLTRRSRLVYFKEKKKNMRFTLRDKMGAYLTACTTMASGHVLILVYGHYPAEDTDSVFDLLDFLREHAPGLFKVSPTRVAEAAEASVPAVTTPEPADAAPLAAAEAAAAAAAGAGAAGGGAESDRQVTASSPLLAESTPGTQRSGTAAAAAPTATASSASTPAAGMLIQTDRGGAIIAAVQLLDQQLQAENAALPSGSLDKWATLSHYFCLEHFLRNLADALHNGDNYSTTVKDLVCQAFGDADPHAANAAMRDIEEMCPAAHKYIVSALHKLSPGQYLRTSDLPLPNGGQTRTNNMEGVQAHVADSSVGPDANPVRVLEDFAAAGQRGVASLTSAERVATLTQHMHRACQRVREQAKRAQEKNVFTVVTCTHALCTMHDQKREVRCDSVCAL